MTRAKTFQDDRTERKNFLKSAGAEMASLAALAARFDQAAFVAELLELGADVKYTDDKGQTVLHRAVESCSANGSSIRAFISKGADVNARDNWKKTPLHMAAESGNAEAIRVLLKHGANIEAQTATKNYTPLVYAAMHIGQSFKSSESIEVLLAHGANPDPKNTPSPLACVLSQDDNDSHNTLKELRKAAVALINAGAKTGNLLKISPTFDYSTTNEKLVRHILNVLDKPTKSAQAERTLGL